jgi:ABC-type uncharacterized transport system substrate-binding protein
VFCGVNADPSKYGYPASNVTGIIERPHFKETLEYLNGYKPVGKVAVLSSDDPTSVGALHFMKDLFVDEEMASFDLVGSFSDWKSKVLEYNGTVDAFCVYMYHTLKDEGETISMEPKDVMRWTAENSKVPTLGFFEFGVEDGLLMGVVESGEEHGERAAEYAVRILSGTPVKDLPVTKAERGLKMINRDTAERLGYSFNKEMEADA